MTGATSHPAASRLSAPRKAGQPTALMRAIPNWLTASRVIMAGIFFAVLTAWRWDDSAAEQGHIDWLLLSAAALFAVAVATDAFDGYLARLWNAESAFGRIMDPFADKILVMGAFVYLASPDFWVHLPGRADIAGHGLQVSGIYPWMVVLMLARELLVTSIRGVMEAQGVRFSSDWWGKGKMILQSIIVPLVLGLIAVAPVVPRGLDGLPMSPRSLPDPNWPWGRWAVDLVVWLTLAVTVISGVPYILRCWAILARARGGKAGDALANTPARTSESADPAGALASDQPSKRDLHQDGA